MESNQEQQNQDKGARQKSTAVHSGRSVGAIIGILVGIAVVLLVVNGMLKKDAPVDKGNVVMGNVNVPSTDGNVNTLTNTNQPMVIDNTNQPPEVITTMVDTSDWKSYQSDSCQLQIKYPPDWKVEEEIIKSDIVNEMIIRLNISPIKKRTYQNPNGVTDEIPGVTLNCYPKNSADKVSRSLGFGVMGITKKVRIGSNTMILRDGQPEFNPPYGDNRFLEALIDDNKTLLISSWGYDADIFFGVLKTLSLP